MTEVCIAAFTRVASEGFLEEVTCGQRPNDAKEPALERVGLEERGSREEARSPWVLEKRKTGTWWHLAMEKVPGTAGGLGRHGRPGEEFAFQGHWMGTRHCCLRV